MSAARNVTIPVNLPEAGTGPTVGSFAREGISHRHPRTNPNTIGGFEALAPARELLDRG